VSNPPASSAPSTVDPAESPPCLRRTVAAAMKEDRRLEAVKIDRDRRALEVATLGAADAPGAAAALTEKLEALHAAPQANACALLDGTDDCDSCPVAYTTQDLPAIQVQRHGSTVTLARVTCPTAPRFWRWREMPLPRLEPRQVTFSGEEDYDREWRAQLLAATLCGLFGILGWLASDGTWSMALYLVAYTAGAWFTVGEIRERLQAGILDIHFLMLAVAAGSAAIGAFGEGAALLFLFSLSGALEHFAMGRTQREIRSLFRDVPKVAARLDETGREIPTPVDQLQAGMRLRVRPGEQFSVDAEVRTGETACDESTLTGESTPVDKQPGDTVLAGTLNTWGSVEVVVLRPARESALQKVIRLIQEAQHLKAPAQRFTDRFSTGYTYAVLGLSLAMFLFWWLARGLPPWVSTADQSSAFYRAMTLLVVASPCALVLSIPSAVLAAIAWAARRGILFRGGAAVERLAGIQVVAMDKTGTLTSGELRVESAESFPAGREDEVMRWALALEQHSHHPLARAITRHGKHRGWTPLPIERFESLNGLGVTGRIQGQPVWLGRREWIRNVTGWQPPAGVSQAEPGTSEIWLWSQFLVGRILLRDDLRPAAPQLVADLKRHGLRVVVLTGDRPEAAENLRRHVGLDDLRAGLSPEAKVAAIKEYVDRRQPVAMIGDGVNDAPSLAAADVGVAMGARGADAALEQAEIVLMKDRLENFLTAFELSRRARQIIRQNLAISLGTVVVLVAFALTGGIPLTIGVVGHEGSTVVVVLNSLRLLFRRAQSP
jgi:Cd2+/Zn2+-exporting ATPase